METPQINLKPASRVESGRAAKILLRDVRQARNATARRLAAMVRDR